MKEFFLEILALDYVGPFLIFAIFFLPFAPFEIWERFVALLLVCWPAYCLCYVFGKMITKFAKEKLEEKK